MTEIHKDYQNIPSGAKGCVVAIGNFDGLHPGHRALLAEAATMAARLHAPLGVMTFAPHPRRFFKPGAPPFQIMTLETKCRGLARLGVKHVFALPFNAALAGMGARDFIDAVLKNGLGARHIVVGEDFCFGRERSGTTGTLQDAADSGLFGLTRVPAVADSGGAAYASSRVRESLRAGELDEAAALLGAPFEWEGKIIHGEKRGRAIGFPTANQDVAEYLHLPHGIYAVRALVEGEPFWREGVASYGLRPMFKVEQPLLETYIFDFDSDIYGKNMRVRPVKYLREEMKFSDIGVLKERISMDCEEARTVLKSA